MPEKRILSTLEEICQNRGVSPYVVTRPKDHSGGTDCIRRRKVLQLMHSEGFTIGELEELTGMCPLGIKKALVK